MDTVIYLALFLAYYVDIKENMHDFYLHERYFVNM
jgi:hypothetical protein